MVFNRVMTTTPPERLKRLVRCWSIVTVMISFAFAGIINANAEKPNILFIFADDQAFHTINAFGNKEIETPNLDRLVADGTTFTHAYNQGAWGGAVCVASRTMLLTGRYLWHAHKDHSQTDDLYRKTGKMLPQTLEKAGYETYFSGKWHLRADAAKAFNNARHIRPGMPKAFKEGYHRPHEGKEDVWKPWDKKWGGFWEGGIHWSEVLGNDATDYLKMAAEKDDPFFMYLAFNAPHDPRQAPKEYVDKYPLDKISIPDNFLPEYPYNVGSNKIRDEVLAPFPRTHFAVKTHIQEYYAIITHMDDQIGRMLNALEKSGKKDNTYIIFSADHGLGVGQHGFMGKQNMYDHSVRVPLIISGPGIKKDHKIKTPVYLQDIHPTIIELAGQKKPDHVEFRSFAPLLKGTSGYKPYNAMYSAYVDFQRMISKGNFKLILYPKIKKARLFNLKKDPHETNDLLDDSQKKNRLKKAKSLAKVLQKWNKEFGDDMDLSQSFPELYE